MSYILKVRSQINDAFSDFRKYIAPTYYHDRCERSLQMHLYVMHKREVLLALLGFCSTFVLLLFIGLAGPNVAKLDEISASEMFEQDKMNASISQRLISTGPFAVTTTSLSTYSQQLCLFLTFHLKNEETSEAFHKDIVVAVQIDGDESGKLTKLFADDGRTYQLYCSALKCEPIEVLHLQFLQYARYRVQVRFSRLESVHEKYFIRDITFSFQSVNPSFTTLTIWFRFFFLVGAFLVTCWFTHSLHRHPFLDWSLEQKWTALLLVLLLAFNNPFYPMQFLFGSSFPRLMEIVFHNTLTATVLLFWLCFFHGIRQNARTFSRFYAPKFVIVGLIWLSTLYVSTWSSNEKLRQPTFDEQKELYSSAILSGCSFFFYLSLAAYFIYLLILVMGAFTELRSMPYFDLRLKLQSLLISFVLAVSVLVVLFSSSTGTAINNNVATKIPFIQLLPLTYQSNSSAAFLSLFSLINLYVVICAYFYYPTTNALIDSRIVRDNPTLSMINDSDEDVIYGSDAEEPLNTPKLIETTNDDEESD